jgi:hypothetical protein
MSADVFGPHLSWDVSLPSFSLAIANNNLKYKSYFVNCVLKNNINHILWLHLIA